MARAKSLDPIRPGASTSLGTNGNIRDPRDLIGVPFRLHGRDLAMGLDCVGVVAMVLGADAVPSGYRLRRAVSDEIVEGLEAAGLVRVEGGARAGDVLLIAAGPAQFHLGVKTEAGFVHACALLKRVVETPGIPENLVGVWRRGHP
jgi:murein DD-endopeptidase / murein LD-carboxypeptidase